MISILEAVFCGSGVPLTFFADGADTDPQGFHRRNDSHRQFDESHLAGCSFGLFCVWSSTASTSHPGSVSFLSRKTGKKFGSGSRINQSENFSGDRRKALFRLRSLFEGFLRLNTRRSVALRSEA